MKFNFNLPKRVTKVKLVLTEENEGQVVQEKEYVFKRKQLDIFDNEYKRAAYINSLIGYDWRNPVSKRGKVAKEGTERKEEESHPFGTAVESIVKELTKSEEKTEGGDVE